MALEARIHRRGFCCGLLSTALVGGVAWAQGEGITSEVLGQGHADYAEALDGPADVVTARVTLAPGASLDWHTHPGPVTGVITKGTLTVHQADGCTAVYPAGAAVFVPRDFTHFERNEAGEPLEFIATFVVPAGSPLRIPAPASDAVCGQ